MMEQIEILQMEPDVEELFCLPEAPEVPEQEPVNPNVFTLVVETTNYRVEIEIG